MDARAAAPGAAGAVGVVGAELGWDAIGARPCCRPRTCRLAPGCCLAAGTAVLVLPVCFHTNCATCYRPRSRGLARSCCARCVQLNLLDLPVISTCFALPFAIPARRPRSRCLAWSCCASWTRAPPPTSSPPSSASPPPSGAASWHPSSARVGGGWCGLGSRLRWLDPWKKLAAAW